MVRKLCLAAVLALAWAVAGDRPARTVHAADKPAAGKSAPYVHCVIFHLKKDAPENAAEGLITDAQELLAKIPSVREVKAGRPADKGTPDLAKKDFQVGLLVLVEDFDALKAYLDHPLHQEY